VGTIMLEDGLAGVFSMATAPDMRARGVASALLASLLTWAWEHGAARTCRSTPAPSGAGRLPQVGFTIAYTYHYCGRPGEERQ
jgi:GNAT superfamily N-acetyltransferase